MNKYIQLSDEVIKAKAKGIPVVALESSIIAQGMPYPDNLDVALTVEYIIREQGCVPATTAVVGGRILVGLEKDQLTKLASEKDVLKVGMRDFPQALTSQKVGATTVSALLHCCKLANISVAVTGGIGGVHRDIKETLDLSADLIALSKGNTVLVAAGVKSILDIPKTLEFLETLGVPVLGWKTEEFPAFFTPHSGQPVSWCIHSLKDLVTFMEAHRTVGSGTSVLLGNPIPVDDGLDPLLLDSLIKEALEQSLAEGIVGKAVTPFLLQQLVNATEGKTLEANKALVYNNARLGAEVATALQTNSGNEDSFG